MMGICNLNIIVHSEKRFKFIPDIVCYALVYTRIPIHWIYNITWSFDE